MSCNDVLKLLRSKPDTELNDQKKDDDGKSGWFGGAWVGSHHVRVCITRRRFERSRSLISRSGVASPRSAPQSSVCSGRRLLRRTSRLSPDLTQSRCHPAFRSEKAFQQGGKVKIGIEPREMQPKTRRTDLNRFKLRGPGAFQSLRVAGRKAYRQVRTEFHDYPPTRAVIVGRHCIRRCLFELCGSLICQCEMVKRCHEFSPKMRTNLQWVCSWFLESGQLPFLKSEILAYLHWARHDNAD